MIDEMQIRPYVESDAEAIADLMNAVDAKHGAEAGWTGGEMRSFIKAWVRDPATDSRLVVTSDGVLAATGIVSPPPEGGQRADMLGGVHPTYQGRGLGRALLAWQYDRARQLHSDIAPRDQWHVEAGASVGDTAAIRLFERLELRAGPLLLRDGRSAGRGSGRFGDARRPRRGGVRAGACEAAV